MKLSFFVFWLDIATVVGCRPIVNLCSAVGLKGFMCAGPIDMEEEEETKGRSTVKVFRRLSGYFLYVYTEVKKV